MPITKRITQPSASADFGTYLDSEALSQGQRRRLELFKRVEPNVCARIEELCQQGEVAVTDVAVLLMSPEARAALFPPDEDPPGITVVMGHREKLYAFLHATLPEAEELLSDPYEDLLKAAPPLCVRVLILDENSATVMSYGTFVTVELSRHDMAQA